MIDNTRNENSLVTAVGFLSVR